MIYIPLFISFVILASSWFWFAMYWNFLIMGDGDEGTPKQLLWSAIGLLVGVLQFAILVISYGPEGPK